jgi:hypothetical protein
MNVIFYEDDDQRLKAEASKTVLAKKIGRKVKTNIAPLRSFTMAEDYHQKYLLKRHDNLKNEMIRIYPNHRDFVDSTAVARLNGYVGGYGGSAQLSREIENLGLSAKGQKTLLDLVRK